jgi:hypothetical protein
MTHANKTALPRKIHRDADLGLYLGITLVNGISEENFHTSARVGAGDPNSCCSSFYVCYPLSSTNGLVVVVR